MPIFLIIGLIIGGGAVLFVLQNITPVTVSFFSWSFSGSLSVVLIAALLTGMLVSVLVLLPSFLRAEWQVRRLVKANKKLMDDLSINNMTTPSKVTEPQPVGGEPTVDFDKESK